MTCTIYILAPISENDANGTWKINWVYLSDKQGNSTSVYNNGIGEVDFSSCDFEVTGNKKVDITAPELKSIKVDKKNVETGDVVTFTAEVTDDISGVKYVYVYLDIPGINRKQDVILEKKEDNIYEGSYTIWSYVKI